MIPYPDEEPLRSLAYRYGPGPFYLPADGPHRLTPAEERAAGRLVEYVARPRSVLPGVLWTFCSAVLAGVLFLCLVWPR